MGAVKNAIQRDQQDPTIMDLDAEKSLESQRPSVKEEGNDPPLKEDPMYSKYFKMLKMVSNSGRRQCSFRDASQGLINSIASLPNHG